MTPDTNKERAELIDLIAHHLHGTYHCTRVWHAWGIGTMSQDDFEDVCRSDTPAELADAILASLAANAPAAPTQASPDGWKWMTHPSRNGGLPIPVRVFAEDGVTYYQPFSEADCEFEWESRDSEWHEAAPPAPTEQWINAADMAALQRVNECIEDNEGFDVPIVQMKRMAELGVVRRIAADLYSLTAFGRHLIDDGFRHTPLETVDECNARLSAEHFAKFNAALPRAQPNNPAPTEQEGLI